MPQYMQTNLLIKAVAEARTVLQKKRRHELHGIFPCLSSMTRAIHRACCFALIVPVFIFHQLLPRRRSSNDLVTHLCDGFSSRIRQWWPLVTSSRGGVRFVGSMRRAIAGGLWPLVEPFPDSLTPLLAARLIKGWKYVHCTRPNNNVHFKIRI